MEELLLQTGKEEVDVSSIVAVVGEGEGSVLDRLSSSAVRGSRCVRQKAVRACAAWFLAV